MTQLMINKRIKYSAFLLVALSLNCMKACDISRNRTKWEASPITNAEKTDTIHYKSYNCNYMNEAPPNKEPAIFAKGIVSTSADEICFEISKDGEEIMIDRAGIIFMSKQVKGDWTDLYIAPFSGKTVDGECCFSPDGKKIYFASRRQLQGARGTLNTWVSEKTEEGWGSPYPLKEPLWNNNTHAVSVSESGNIYMSGVEVYHLKDGEYLPKVRLNENIVGTHPFISPDEKFIIICARKEGRWDKDLFISYNNDGIWSDPQALNDRINTKSKESNPFVTPDGKYLFFQRANNIYWVEFCSILNMPE